MPQISKQQIKDVILSIERNISDADYDAVLFMLQGLLDQPEGKPVAELLLSRSGHGIVVEWHKTVPVGAKLYTHPAPFTPITADDGSDWFYKLQFICRVLSNGKSGDVVDLQTAHGMAQSLKKEAWLVVKSLKPITADDVTDETADTLNKATHPSSSRKEIIAAAVNAYLGAKK
jgi:hypothetical protein